MSPLAHLERGALPGSTCAAWVRAVYEARPHWTSDFSGEQFALGMAFYTHHETDRGKDYFRRAAASDALVDRVLPGMQQWARDLVARHVGGMARPRMGFCGAGVHVFPAGGKVAREGGVVHYDVEGLSPLSIQKRQPTLSLVVMLQAPERGGGLWVYDRRYRGSEAFDDEDLKARKRLVRYKNGDALYMSSSQLHQIRPFSGSRDRISITLHAVEVDRGVWETWF